MIILISMIYHYSVSTLQKIAIICQKYWFQTQEGTQVFFNKYVSVTFSILQTMKLLAGIPILGLETVLFLDTKKERWEVDYISSLLTLASQVAKTEYAQWILRNDSNPSQTDLLNTYYLFTTVFGLGDINMSSLWCHWR